MSKKSMSDCWSLSPHLENDDREDTERDIASRCEP